MTSDLSIKAQFSKAKSMTSNPSSFRQTTYTTTSGDRSHSFLRQINSRRFLANLFAENPEAKGDHGTAHASADSSLPTQPRNVNVVLFGETGVGKSSVINLIARKEVAQVSSDVNGCTMQSTRYDISFDDMNFAIFDTISLEEPQIRINGYLKAIENMYELVVKLGAAGGVHLLLFCMRGGRITATTQSNYRLFCECLCSTKVPIALVFTGLEREAEMEDWWVRNKTHIEHYGIKSNGHACITAVQDDTLGEDLEYTESQRKIRELLKTCALQNDPFSLELHPWLARLGWGLRSFIEKHRNPKRRDVMRALTHRCKLDPETARKIATMMKNGDTETKEGNQDEQEGIKENEGKSNPGHVKDEVKKNTAEVDPHSTNVPRGKDKSGIANENGARDRALATPHGDGEAGPHTVGPDRKDGGKPRIDKSLVVVEQAMSERVDTIRPSVSVHEISDIHSSGKLGDTTEVDPRSANVSRGKDKSGIASKNAARDPTSMMEKGDTETKDGKDEDPGQCSFEELERLGDAEVGAKRYNEAICHYSTALSLFSSSQTILIKRSRAWLANGSWKEALDDANQVTTLDPSSPWGYELKHAALHEIGDYDNAIVAFETMVSKMKHWPDPDVQQKSDKYISPSSTQATIRGIVQQTTRRLPRVLINTTTGRLHDRAEHASAFESLPVFKELVSSMTKRIDYVRIKCEVRHHFRYVMLSHKWEDNEPLFQKVIHIAVYDLDKSPTHDKLQTFCRIVRDAGFNWAWSDTCCIDKSDHFVLQEALVAMFRWYQGSTMVIVFLRGVHPSSPCGALAASVWNTRAWTLQEYIAAKVIRFYTEDWTLYGDLDFPNHKESPEIISEMEQATGISAQQLMALSPGLSSIREKLRLASTRMTTWIEDTAYSLLGIFSAVGISAIYGEGEASLGRLLANLMTRSGDASILAWTGESSHFNSCLPTHISVFNGPAATHLPSPISDPEMEHIITGLQAPSFDLDTALRLYDRLIELPTPRFAESRMTLPCIAFQLPPFSVHRTPLGRVYRTNTFPFGVLEIRTRHDLSRMKTVYLVHPWLDTLLQHENMQSAAFVEDVVQPASPDTDDGEIFDEKIGDDSLSLPELPSPVDIVSTDKDDRETRAQRLVARLRQPFGALLFTLASDRRSTDYRRVAADSMTTVQFHDNISLADILDNVRILDVL